MPKRSNASVSPRKQPKQARSNELVSIVLEAAVQVLEKEGAARFTTARVADRAGVSVGSIYQYFPNKASILFRLSSQEWRETADLWRRVLGDRQQPPAQRLLSLAIEFFRSECREAKMRRALDDAAPLYRDAPEARESRLLAQRAVKDFVVELLPRVSIAEQSMATSIITATLSGLGKSASESPRDAQQIDSFANAVALMLWAYLQTLKRRSV